MNAAEFIQFFLTICGGISIVGGAAEVLEDHDRRDFETLKRIADRDSLILEVLSTMLDSQISGNNVEELKKTKQKLTEYLTANQR